MTPSPLCFAIEKWRNFSSKNKECADIFLSRRILFKEVMG